MPIHQGRDTNGSYFQWGEHGKKYYFDPNDQKSKQDAKQKAVKQAIAIYASGWREHGARWRKKGLFRFYDQMELIWSMIFLTTVSCKLSIPW